MPRRSRDNDLLDVLYNLFKVTPWYVGPIFAALAYPLFRFAIPAFLGYPPPPHPGPATLSSDAVTGIVAQTFAPISLLILAIALVAQIPKWLNRRLLPHHASPTAIDHLSWQEFESLLAETYRRLGYRVLHTGSNSPDGGIDLILSDPAGKKILVQAKHWKNRPVRVHVARELLGLVTAHHATYGLLITSGSFTPDAHAFAQSTPLIRLIDGPALQSLLTSAQSPTPSSLPVTPIAANPPSLPTCPLCHAPMLLRTARHGPNPGSQFLGCSRYPTCTSTRHFTPATH